MLLLSSVYHVICKENWYVCTPDLSYTRDLIEGGCEKKALPHASELILPSNNSKLDCMGLKVDNLHEYLMERRMMAHFKEEEPCNMVT